MRAAVCPPSREILMKTATAVLVDDFVVTLIDVADRCCRVASKVHRSSLFVAKPDGSILCELHASVPIIIILIIITKPSVK